MDTQLRRRAFGWRTLLIAATVAVIVSLLAPMLFQGVEPFLLAMAAPFVIGLVVLLLRPRAGAVVLGVVSIAILAVTIPFAIESLGHPEAATDFVPLVVLTVGTLIAAVAAWPARREEASAHRSGTPVALAAVSVGVIVMAGVVSVVASAGVEDVAARPGDIEVITSNLAFDPVRVEATTTGVAIHLQNDDATRHTFTIDELGVDVSIAPNSSARVAVDAEPGEYRFYCRPHAPSMEGTLVVAAR